MKKFPASPLSVILIAAALQLLAQQRQSPEVASLQRALSEAGNSPIEFVRAIENHLKEYPNSAQRAELEHALVKAAIDLNDDRLLSTYGESVLSRDPNDVQVLEHVATALLHQGGQANAQRALEHAQHLAGLIQATFQNDKFEPGGGPAEVTYKKE